MKRILLITYYFPPCGGAPVQRWLRFIPRLIDSGYGVTVICPEQGDYPSFDPSLLETIPGEVKIIRCGKNDIKRWWRLLTRNGDSLPYGNLERSEEDSWLKRLIVWLRLNLVIPDMRMVWNPSALNHAITELRSNAYNAVITTGPPQSTHLIGLKLKQMFPVYWITDFRDPWSEIHYLKLNPPGKHALKLHKHLEQKVLSTADMNVIVSHSIADQLPEGNKVVIYNGFEPEQFAKLSFSSGEQFRIKYIGMITAGQRLEPLINAMNDLHVGSTIEFSVIGKNDKAVLEKIKAASKSYSLKISDFLPHAKALEEMVNAELLVLLINEYEGNEGMLTTKLFEYLGSRTPILCLGNTRGEAAEVIRTCDAGNCFEYEDSGVSEYIRSVYQSWKDGNPLRSTGIISAYGTTGQIGKLLELIPDRRP